MNVHELNYAIWAIARELVHHHRYSLMDNDEGMLTLKRRDGIRVTYLYLMPLVYGQSAEQQEAEIREQFAHSMDWMKMVGFRRPALVHRMVHLYIRTDAGYQMSGEQIASLHLSSLTESHRIEAGLIDLVDNRAVLPQIVIPGAEFIQQFAARSEPVPYDETRLYEVIDVWHGEMLRAHQERVEPFEEAGRKRGAPLTFAFVAINVVVWLLMTYYGGSTNTATLIQFGAKYAPLIDEGEYWRLVTPMFLHIGGLHLWFNTVSLLSLGGRIERVLGSGTFFLLYMTAGIVGNLSSYWFSPSISAGASGAIFGLMGALLYLTVKEPDTWGEMMGFSIYSGLVMNVILGFVVPGIDNYAHFGGLVGGYLFMAARALLTKKEAAAS
ncbi:rhomboid family intramembrane serine protease [Paenibacillus xanthanilyticus]|uniref:Rhomboid family intramembrane serine protease n=1 Tax=Paenibacillus xanthanilyticus TaxID=1783531 RepID=A0ABV8K706_9BACL